MFDNLFNNNSENNDKAKFDLELNQLNRFADILFFIGTILAIQSTNVTEKLIIMTQLQQLSSQEESAATYDIAKLLATANWIFLIAGITFFNTSIAALKEEKASMLTGASLSSKERVYGREIVTVGNFIKVIGFALSAIGYDIIADSTDVETNS